MKPYLITIVLIAFLGNLTSCSKTDDAEEPLPSESKECRMLQFLFKSAHNEQLTADVTAEIDENSKQVTVTVPALTDVSGLVADFKTSANAVATVQEIVQVSGVTINDFSGPVIYTVTAEDGTTRLYTVSVNVAVSEAAFISRFEVLKEHNPSLSANIKGFIALPDTAVHFRNPYKQVTVFVPSIDVSPGAILLLDGDTVISGSTAVDFSQPRTFRVQAASGNTNDYVISMRPGIIDFEDFINECPQRDPNIDEILSDFQIRVDGNVVTSFTCGESYVPMDTEEFTDAIKWLQTLRVLYYLDMEQPVELPWTNLRLYDWIKSKIDGINIVTGMNGGNCCSVNDGKTLINVGRLEGNSSGALASIPNVYSAWAINNFSLLLHEARHMDGFPHSDCCPAGADRCDATYDPENPSPYGLQVWWNTAVLENKFSFGFGCLSSPVIDFVTQGATIAINNGKDNFCTPFTVVPQVDKEINCIYH